MKGKVTIDPNDIPSFENIVQVALSVGVKEPRKGVEIMFDAGKVLLGEILSSEEGDRLLKSTNKFVREGDVSPFFDLMRYTVDEASKRVIQFFEKTPLCRGEKDRREFGLIVKTMALRGLTNLSREDLWGYGLSLFRERDIKVLGIPAAVAAMMLRDSFGAFDLSEILGVEKSWSLDYFI